MKTKITLSLRRNGEFDGYRTDNTSMENTEQRFLMKIRRVFKEFSPNFSFKELELPESPHIKYAGSSVLNQDTIKSMGDQYNFVNNNVWDNDNFYDVVQSDIPKEEKTLGKVRIVAEVIQGRKGIDKTRMKSWEKVLERLGVVIE